MFAVIYRFSVKQGKDEVFEKAWHELTHLIYKHTGSLGSRLHQQNGTEYIAYAQWPDKSTWEESADKLPQSSASVRKEMREACEKIETLHELQVIDDLLETKVYE